VPTTDLVVLVHTALNTVEHHFVHTQAAHHVLLDDEVVMKTCASRMVALQRVASKAVKVQLSSRLEAREDGAENTVARPHVHTTVVLTKHHS
jgi:hypothetical protein